MEKIVAGRFGALALVLVVFAGLVGCAGLNTCRFGRCPADRALVEPKVTNIVASPVDDGARRGILVRWEIEGFVHDVFIETRRGQIFPETDGFNGDRHTYTAFIPLSDLDKEETFHIRYTALSAVLR